MPEIWLRTNRRVLFLGMILPAVLISIGLILALDVGLNGGTWLRVLGWTMTIGGLLLLGLIAVQLKLPRLAYADRQLLVYVQSGGPVRVPVECVECFFFSSGRGQLPGPEGSKLPVRNLVMRIAEKATDYQHRNVKATLGRWDDGYVTIHGAWCEPLTLKVVQQLNARLAEAHRAQQEVPKA
jgi:hypothetical protein